MQLFVNFIAIAFSFYGLLSVPNFGTQKVHPFHTSIGDCNYNPKTHRLEFSVRLFTDDLEKAINAKLTKPIELQASKTAEPELQRYLLANIKVSDAHQKHVLLNVIGKELANDVTWVYLESDTCGATRHNIGQTVLFDYYDDQKNIINYQTGNKKQTFIFDSNNRTHRFE